MGGDSAIEPGRGPVKRGRARKRARRKPAGRKPARRKVVRRKAAARRKAARRKAIGRSAVEETQPTQPPSGADEGSRPAVDEFFKVCYQELRREAHRLLAANQMA